MGNIFFVLFASIFSTSVFANFSPPVGSRPHTACWNEENRFAGIQVFLTDLRTEPDQTLIEIKELSLQDERQVLREKTRVQVRATTEVYEGNQFRLEISRDFITGSSQRKAHLVFLTQNGEGISQGLLCDSLMYPMDIGRANF